MVFKLEIKRFADEEVIGTVKNIEEARSILSGLNGNGKNRYYGLFREVINEREKNRNNLQKIY